MAASQSGETVEVSELTDGDEVVVHVNSRAANHIGTRSFRATVLRSVGDSITFRPEEELSNQEDIDTHTWYTDIGYIHGHHTGLGRYSDIGKVTKVTRRE